MDIFEEPIKDSGEWESAGIHKLFHPSSLQHRKFFDYIQVSNEYQDTGLTLLPQSWVKPAGHGLVRDYNIKKKFRQWRVDIPRDASDSSKPLNRIRNMWAKIELGFIPPRQSTMTEQELRYWADTNNIDTYSITQYYEGLLSGNENIFEASGLAEATTSRIIPAPPPGFNEIEAAYKKMHIVLHDLDVQYFI